MQQASNNQTLGHSHTTTNNTKSQRHTCSKSEKTATDSRYTPHVSTNVHRSTNNKANNNPHAVEVQYKDQCEQLQLVDKTTCFGVRCFSIWIRSCIINQLESDEQPIAFASCSLATVEKNYSQMDKETLVIVFGVKHFHQYLFGRKFVIKSDHKPLQHLFDEQKSIPAMASARVQH